MYRNTFIFFKIFIFHDLFIIFLAKSSQFITLFGAFLAMCYFMIALRSFGALKTLDMNFMHCRNIANGFANLGWRFILICGLIHFIVIIVHDTFPGRNTLLMRYFTELALGFCFVLFSPDQIVACLLGIYYLITGKNRYRI